MAPARVRGCAVQGSPPAAGSPARQADASRRRNGPRKATWRRPITVRLRGKSCPPGRSDVSRTGRRAVVAQAANPSAGGCGDEDQVGRAGVIPHETVEGGFHVDIIFHGRRTGIQERFRDYATAKLDRIVKLDQKTISIDVEVTLERNPRQSAQRERVELTRI